MKVEYQVPDNRLGILTRIVTLARSRIMTAGHQQRVVGQNPEDEPGPAAVPAAVPAVVPAAVPEQPGQLGELAQSTLACRPGLGEGQASV